MHRLRAVPAANNNENIRMAGKGSKLNTTEQLAIPPPILTRQRAALGDIGNRLINRSLPSNAAKKPTVDVPETKKENVLNALKKVEPRKPLRPVASFRYQSNQPTNANNNEPLRHNSVSSTTAVSKASVSSVAEIHRPTVASKLKSKATENVSKKPPLHQQFEKSKPTGSIANLAKALRPPSAPPTVDAPIEKDEIPLISADSSELKDRDAYSTAMIPNIDEEDSTNPQLASEYVNEIYEYMRMLEREQHVRENFLNGQEISGRMRAVLVDWLVQVHVRFHLLPETMFMTTMLIDRFLQEKMIAKDKLQLVGVTAMFLASKYEEMYAPEIGDFVYITDNSYTKEQVRCMERMMLQTLDFRLGKPLPIHFLRRYSKAADADPMKHSLAKYFLELSIIEYQMCHFSPSLLAASALWLTLKLLGDGKWTATLVYYTTYNESDVLPVAKMLSQAVVRAHSDKPKYQAVKNKFSTAKFMEISKHSCLTLPLIKDIALQ